MKKLYAALAFSGLVAISGGAQAVAIHAYQTGTGNPWSQTTNNAAMDFAFGAGNWDFYQGFSMTAFGGATRFVFLDGSGNQANQLNTFLTANIAAIEAFVFAGGSVFINAAPNQGANIAAGFGGVVINYPRAFSGTATVNTAGVAAGLTAGPITTSYTGTWFSHATITGPVTSLIDGTAGVILGERDWGTGFAMFGGQTTTNWHAPNPDAFQLRVNQLRYAAQQAGTGTPVPEPATVALLGLGLVGLAAMRRRKTA